jgi:hypothetical protein
VYAHAVDDGHADGERFGERPPFAADASRAGTRPNAWGPLSTITNAVARSSSSVAGSISFHDTRMI